jgi:site-specific DNA recombinase
VRADRLDALVWDALAQLLHQPSVLPQLPKTWVEAKQHTLSGLEAQQAQLLQRRQRIERQDQRLLDAYQAEIINLHELHARRQKLAAELHQIAQASRHLAHTQQQSIHGQQVMDNSATFRQLLGENLAQLSFAERQAIAQCLISHVIVTGEAVDIHFVLPFASTPQAARRPPKEPEGIPGHFYRLRLAHFDRVEVMAAVGG